jgi:hypothetical protein
VLLYYPKWGQNEKNLGEVGLLGLCERSEKMGKWGEKRADDGGIMAVVMTSGWEEVIWPWILVVWEVRYVGDERKVGEKGYGAGGEWGGKGKVN